MILVYLSSDSVSIFAMWFAVVSGGKSMWKGSKRDWSIKWINVGEISVRWEIGNFLQKLAADAWEKSIVGTCECLLYLSIDWLLLRVPSSGNCMFLWRLTLVYKLCVFGGKCLFEEHFSMSEIFFSSGSQIQHKTYLQTLHKTNQFYRVNRQKPFQNVSHKLA